MTLPVVLTLVALAQAPAAAPESIAIPAWTTVEVKPELAAFFTDHVAGALRTQGFRVVTSAEMASLLSMERQKELLGCSDAASSCMAELANALGCSALLLVNLARLEDTYRGNLKLLRATDGLVLAETRVTAKGQNALLEELEGAATRLADAVRPQPKGGEPPGRGGFKRWWWAPAVVGGVGVLGGGACLGTARSVYDGLARDLRTPADAADPLLVGRARTGETLQTMGWVGVGVGTAFLAGAAALYFFGGDGAASVTPTVSVGPGGASVGVVGVLP